LRLGCQVVCRRQHQRVLVVCGGCRRSRLCEVHARLFCFWQPVLFLPHLITPLLSRIPSPLYTLLQAGMDGSGAPAGAAGPALADSAKGAMGPPLPEGSALHGAALIEGLMNWTTQVSRQMGVGQCAAVFGVFPASWLHQHNLSRMYKRPGVVLIKGVGWVLSPGLLYNQGLFCHWTGSVCMRPLCVVFPAACLCLVVGSE
jgi:hypothetical protein